MSKKQLQMIKIAAIVALGGFLLGFDASVISGVVQFIEPEFSLSKIELGWAVSSITLTAALGMTFAGPLSDTIGRRRMLKIAAILFTISAIGSAIAPSFVTLIIARLIGGLAVGASLILAPMYIAEIAPPEKRGFLVSFNQLNIVLGISIAFFTNYVILKLGESDASWTQTLGFEKWNWRWMLGVEILPAILYFFGLFLVPRSPRWLMMKNKHERALEIMSLVLDHEDAAAQMEEVKQSIKEDQAKPKSRFKDLFKSSMKKVLLIGVIVGAFQQLVGINAVLFYAPMIFELTGIGTDASFVQAILVGLTNLVFTLLAMATIDKLGRKPLLMIGMAGITICLVALSYGFGSAEYKLDEASIKRFENDLEITLLKPLENETYSSDLDFKEALIAAVGEAKYTALESRFNTEGIQINSLLILIGILGFVGSFAMSIGPVMWVLFSELFPNAIRGLAISFVGLINLAASFLVQLLFPWELSNFGSTTTFLLFAGFGFIGFVIMWFLVPETKGKSLEELETELIQ